MDSSELEKKLHALEERFKTVSAEKAEHEKIVGDLEAELFRLQGDYRTIENLIKEASDPPDPEPTVKSVSEMPKTKKKEKEVENATPS